MKHMKGYVRSQLIIKGFYRRNWIGDISLWVDPVSYLFYCLLTVNIHLTCVLGLVGGDIVLHLLLRGQSPESIRIVDFSPPVRSDLRRGSAAHVDFVKTDIVDPFSVMTAFRKPWPSAVSNLPLTVFHTAAAIRPAERHIMLWARTSRVNIEGTSNVLLAARDAGADLFVATSSASLSVRPINFVIAPWWSHPRGIVQICDETDFDQPLRPQAEYFGNYAYSKAIAERMICSANKPGFRTGIIRPGNGIYGSPGDVIYGKHLSTGLAVALAPLNIQNAVSAWNVSLSHLVFEAALARTTMPKCAGRPFVITDAGPAPQWVDFFRAAELLSVTPFRYVSAPTVVIFLISYVVEWWCLLLARFPFLTGLPFRFSELSGDLGLLQPAVFTSALSSCLCVDDAARRSVEDGGLGYVGSVTTLEGVCELIRTWNQEWSKDKK